MDISALPCGFLVLDQKNIVVEANSVFCSWLGYLQHEVINKSFSMFFIPASRMVYLGHILPKLQTLGSVEEKYLILRAASGENLPVLINGHKIEQDNSQIFVFVLMRMVRRDLIEDQLIQQRQLAEKANEEKDLLNKQLERIQAELLLKQQELLRLNADLEALSVTDTLTGLFNRRYYDKELDAKIANFQRTAQKFSLILIDIDFFKSINDTHGHDTGDGVLKAMSRQLQKNIREIDTLARIGGEEFAIILPNCDVDATVIAAERQRKAIENMPEIPFKITASFGVTAILPGDNKTTIYQRADNALYQSKENGRNKVTAKIA